MLRKFDLKGILFLCTVLLALGAAAQTNKKSSPKPTTSIKDTTRTDSLKAKQVGDVKTTVTYTASDSMLFDIDTKKVYLYGQADIDYGDISLNADRVEINWENNTLKATGTPDSAGGKEHGTPVFKQGADQYVAKVIKYNFKTKQGHISEIVTQQGEGYLHGETVRKAANDEMFVQHAQYTTCNLAHPHFYINAQKIKMIPKDKLISGPFNLVMADVPTPLGFFMGIFPTPESRSSGILIPTYGEANDRGFYLRNGGYYWSVNEHIGLNFLGEIYSKGSYGLSVASQYKKRYAYDGNFAIRHNYRKTGDESAPEIFKDYWIEWSHRPVTRKSSSFSASVNAGSSGYNNRNSFNANNYLAASFSSRISYSKTFTGTPFSLGVNASQQQSSSGIMNFTLPDVAFNMMSIYPFRSKTGSTSNWYQNINLSYAMTSQNSISNNRLVRPTFSDIDEKLYNRELDNMLVLKESSAKEVLNRMNTGVSHRIPISTTFRILNNINVSPALSYSENWYFRRFKFNTVNYTAGDSINADTTNGFYRVYNYNASVSLNTRMYGTFYTRRSKKIEAFRHTINPNIGFSYQPDFSNSRYGMYQRVTANGKEYVLDPYQGSLYGGASRGKSASMSFGLTNSLEVKLRAKPDTNAKADAKPPKGKKVSLIDNFSVNSAYNFVADSFNLAPISMRAQTNILGRFALNVGATLDPYIYVHDSKSPTTGTRINKFAWDTKGKGLGQFSNFMATLSTSLNPAALKPKTLAKAKNDPNLQSELDFINANRDLYVDFTVPWNLSINYAFYYSKTGYAASTITQSVTVSGDISITKNWKITSNSGYDFKSKQFVYPNIGIFREMHCWQMRFDWTPTGTRGGSFNINISPKASILQDLKFTRRRSWYDG